ncbi:aspartate--tRNA ligase [Candidatus Woesearchaeota archaeon]|nr:aspartate--tRNA ligase [Candidatus Woesearchaeota archaeon]
MRRTHTCGELRDKHAGKAATLQGWVDHSRNHGGVIFINLRDRYGLTQLVVRPDNEEAFRAAESLKRESVVSAVGKVVTREQKNPNIPTGDVELVVDKLIINCLADPLPVEYKDAENMTEDNRLKYRYLDLRRPEMFNKLYTRHLAAQAAREYLSSQGFLEIDTPMLLVSTPEGARDYVVPSRVNPGKFYALPQSPQIFKQILMVSGVDKYFQLPRCLRDEDLRSDRQPEHTQIDLEMSFPELDTLFTVGEGVMKNVLKKTIGYDLETPFPRLSHSKSVEMYGNDKPDLRFDLKLCDVSDIAESSDFKVFKDCVSSGGIVKAICPEAQFSRKEVEEFEKLMKQNGAKGLVALKVTADGIEGGVAKFFNDAVKKKLIDRTKVKDGSTIFIVADTHAVTNDCLARLRNELGRKLELYNPKDFRFCWITDFPLYEWDAENNKWEMGHNPFSKPKDKDIELLDTDPGKVYCEQYDLVLNGWEMASGSIRNANPELQARVLNVVGLTMDDVKRKFGFMLEAFRYGVPPHGGMGIGFDRLVALMCYDEDIREVIAFPKNKNAQNPMDGSPGEISAEQFKELHIKLDLPKK